MFTKHIRQAFRPDVEESMDYLNLSINETNKTKKGNSYLPQLSILFLAVRRCMTTTYLLLKYLKRHINKVCFPIFILVFIMYYIYLLALYSSVQKYQS